MNWTNNTKDYTTCIKEVKIGEVFEFNEIFYIKISEHSCFDIINNLYHDISYIDGAVIKREHEIIIM